MARRRKAAKKGRKRRGGVYGDLMKGIGRTGKVFKKIGIGSAVKKAGKILTKKGLAKLSSMQF
jgi:hypothetical protein